MDFQKFSKTLLCRTQIYLGNEYEAQLQSVTKNNGVILTGIMAKGKDTNAHPTVYIDDLFEDDLTAEDVDYIAMKLARNLINAQIPNITEINKFTDYSFVKDRIMYKLVNAEKNRDELSNRPHRRWHNLAICYYYLVPSDIIDSKATIQITTSHMEMWKVDEAELYKTAAINTKSLLPCKRSLMMNLIKENFNQEVIDTGINIFVLTNDDKLNGAITMLYDGELSAVSKELNDNLFILPSSIHEVIVLPEKAGDARTLVDMVTEVNKTSVLEDEVLADSVYFYDAESDTIEWVY